MIGISLNLAKAWQLVRDNPEYWKAEYPDSPPWCRAKAPYYHWATDEPKNFKAVGKGYNNIVDGAIYQVE